MHASKISPRSAAGTATASPRAARRFSSGVDQYMGDAYGSASFMDDDDAELDDDGAIDSLIGGGGEADGHDHGQVRLVEGPT